MRCIDALAADSLRGRRVLVRVGLDLPLDAHGEVSDAFRIQKALPTIRFLKENGACVVLLSHIGRDPRETNAPVFRALKKHLPVYYVPDLLGHAAKDAVAALREGDVLLLENLRSDPREMANDPAFARELANFGELYVDDAFSNAHREHASMVGIPKLLPSYAGMLMRDEVNALMGALMPVHPCFAILGGAKFETKAPLAKALLTTYDHLLLTGALANDVFKARGFEVGISLVSSQLPDAEVLTHPHFLAPADVTVERPDKQARVKKPNEVATDEKIVDIGPDTIAEIAPMIAEAKFILWNGPTGLYEDGYTAWTHAIVTLIQKRVAAGAKAVIGGGDTIAAIQEFGVSEEQVGFLSTGGGAMLDYLVKGTLPAVEALK